MLVLILRPRKDGKLSELQRERRSPNIPLSGRTGNGTRDLRVGRQRSYHCANPSARFSEHNSSIIQHYVHGVLVLSWIREADNKALNINTAFECAIYGAPDIGHTFTNLYSLLPCIQNPRPQCARHSKLCYSHFFPFIGNGTFLCANVVDLPCGKDATKVFFAKLTQINILSIQFWRLLALDSKISYWIPLKIVRKSLEKAQITA